MHCISSDAKNLWNTVVKMFCFVFSSMLRVMDVLGTFATVQQREECGLEAWNGERIHVLCASYYVWYVVLYSSPSFALLISIWAKLFVFK